MLWIRIYSGSGDKFLEIRYVSGSYPCYEIIFGNYKKNFFLKIFFCLRVTLGFSTLFHNDPAAHQDQCGRCRIRTRDLLIYLSFQAFILADEEQKIPDPTGSGSTKLQKYQKNSEFI